MGVRPIRLIGLEQKRKAEWREIKCCFIRKFERRDQLEDKLLNREIYVNYIDILF